MQVHVPELSDHALAELEAAGVLLPINDENQILPPLEMKEWIHRRQTEGLYISIGIGLGLRAIKNQLPHGEFTAWREDCGIPIRSSQQYMKNAKAFLEYSSLTKSLVGGLPGQKMIALSSSPPHVINDLAESGAFDDIKDMSVKEIKEITRLNAAKNKAEAQRDQAIDQLKQATEAPNQPMRSILVDALREDSSFESSVIVHALDKLSQMLEYAHADPQFNALPKANIDLGLETLIININGALGHATQLLNKTPALAADMPAIVFDHHLSDEEVETHIKRCDLMRKTAEDELDRREVARKNERKKGQKGRPFKAIKA